VTATTEPRLQLSALERAVLETIVYSDVFDFALTASEVQRWLRVAASLEDVEAVLRSEPLSALLSSLSPYVMLRGREELVEVRHRRLLSSRKLQRQARHYASLIARLPFVRMVALTGSLAVDSSEAGDDVDYLIVTAPGRVWLARTATMLVVRLAALRGVTVCPNYVLSVAALELPCHEAYTARELLQMAPLFGAEVHRRMLAANGWWRDYLPNVEPVAMQPRDESGQSLLRRGFEALLGGRLGDALEGWLYRRKAGELQRQARGIGETETVFDETMCKGHFEGYRRRTEDAVAQRLAQVLSR
jgi:hypothetical protein